MDESEVNGFRNYNTWCVALMCDNERGSYEHWRERAKYWRAHVGEQSQVKSGCWTESQAARFYLADELEETITDGNPLNNQPSLYADLLSSALSDVDWKEIAANWLEDLQSETTASQEESGNE